MKQSNFFEFEKANNKFLIELSNYPSLVEHIQKENATLLLPFNQTLLDTEITIGFMESHIIYRKADDPTLWVSMNGVRGTLNRDATELNIIAGPPKTTKLRRQLDGNPTVVFEDLAEFEAYDSEKNYPPTESKIHVLRTGTFAFRNSSKVVPLLLISQPLSFPDAEKPKRRNSFSSSDHSSSGSLTASASMPNINGFSQMKARNGHHEVQKSLFEYLREENTSSVPSKAQEDVHTRINNLLTLHDKNNSEKLKSGNRLFTEENLAASLANTENDSDTSSEKSNLSRSSELTIKNKKFKFSDFVEKMRHQSAINLVKKIKRFINELTKEEYVPENYENPESSFSFRVQKFLQEVMKEINAHPQWKNASEQEIDNAREGIEKYVMTKLYNKVFSPTIEDVNIDNEISIRLSMFAKKLQPHHLDIDPNLVDDNLATAADSNLSGQVLLAISELRKINTYKTPRDKMICVSNCCKIIFNMLTIYYPKEHASADSFLPVMIYMVMKANPPHLHSNLKYVQEFRNPDKLISEAGYFLTNLQSCVVYWRNVDHTSLSISKEEYDQLFGKESAQQNEIFFEDKEEEVLTPNGNEDLESMNTDSPLEPQDDCETAPKLELEVITQSMDSPLSTPSSFKATTFPVTPATNNPPPEPFDQQEPSKTDDASPEEADIVITTSQVQEEQVELTDPEPIVQESQEIVVEQNEENQGEDEISITPEDSPAMDTEQPATSISPNLQAARIIQEFEDTMFHLSDDPFCSVSHINDLRIGQAGDLLIRYRQLHALLSQVKETLINQE